VPYHVLRLLTARGLRIHSSSCQLGASEPAAEMHFFGGYASSHCTVLS